ncbi:hypothetical protein JXA84_05070 [candidate division WOR-3 bacterium]|nr:hypothetical protein [candidate division WOR-3 bacterium]
MSLFLLTALISLAGMFFTAEDSAVFETTTTDTIVALPFGSSPEFYSNGLIPQDYEILDSLRVDINGDCLEEEVYLIKRRFRDWPFSKFYQMESRISENHDEDTMSCSVFVFGRKSEQDSTQSFLWGGSPMFIPFIAIEPYDAELDGVFEIAALESRYSLWEKNIATSVGIWKWDVFGFRKVCSTGEINFNCTEFKTFINLDGTMILGLKYRWVHENKKHGDSGNGVEGIKTKRAKPFRF